jgi:hypothetical protein
MKKFFPFLVLVLFLFSFPVCGKKGPILPPLPKLIQKIEYFEISQRGKKLILEWENPTAYIDGSPLSAISEVEIWLFEVVKQDTARENPTLEEFERTARLLGSITQEEFSKYQFRTEEGLIQFQYPYTMRQKDYLLEKMIFSLRVKAKKRRISGFSPLLTVKPRMLSLPPQAVKATVFQDRIEIDWASAEKNIDQSSPARFIGFNVYRAEGEEPPRRLNSQLVKGMKYSDEDFVIGGVYRYSIRASATESPPFMESDDSGIIEVRAEDTFPPAAPSGLVSIGTENFISLSWDENRDEDLDGYRVWRKMEGTEEFVLLTPQPIHENVFNDTKVERNRRYYYAVTALDVSGNESLKSEGVFEIIKDVCE